MAKCVCGGGGGVNDLYKIHILQNFSQISRILQSQT